MKKKKEETYQITPKGLIILETNDEELTVALMDALELAARRMNCNALLMDSGGWQFISVEKRGKK